MDITILSVLLASAVWCVSPTLAAAIVAAGVWVGVGSLVGGAKR